MRKYVGNEYAQGVELQGYGGELLWIGNVYMPPATNLQTRGIDEENVKNDIEDIIGAIPLHARSVMCGDWNARIGERYPTLGETCIPRRSLDQRIGARAPWVIALCEV